MRLPHPGRLLSVSVIAAALLLGASRVRAVDGDVRMHDPSTIIQGGVSDHMWKVEEIVGLLEAK